MRRRRGGTPVVLLVVAFFALALRGGARADEPDPDAVVARLVREVDAALRARDPHRAVDVARDGVESLSRAGHVDDRPAAIALGWLATAVAERDGLTTSDLGPSWVAAAPALDLYDRALRAAGPGAQGFGAFEERVRSLRARLGARRSAARHSVSQMKDWLEALERAENSILLRPCHPLDAAMRLGACAADDDLEAERRSVEAAARDGLERLRRRASTLRSKAGGHASHAEIEMSLRLALARVAPRDAPGRRAALEELDRALAVADGQLRARAGDLVFVLPREDILRARVEVCRDLGDGVGMRSSLGELGSRWATDDAWVVGVPRRGTSTSSGGIAARPRSDPFPTLRTPWSDAALLVALADATRGGASAEAAVLGRRVVRELPPSTFTRALAAAAADDLGAPVHGRFAARLEEARITFDLGLGSAGADALRSAAALAATTSGTSDADLPALALALERRRRGDVAGAVEAYATVLGARPDRFVPSTWTEVRAAVGLGQLLADRGDFDGAHAVVDRLADALRAPGPLRTQLTATRPPGPDATPYDAPVDLSGLRDLAERLGRRAEAQLVSVDLGAPLAASPDPALAALLAGDAAAAVRRARAATSDEPSLDPADSRRLVLADALRAAGEAEEALAIVTEADRAVRGAAGPDGPRRDVLVAVWAETRFSEGAAVVGDLAAARAHAARARAAARLLHDVPDESFGDGTSPRTRPDPAAGPSSWVGAEEEAALRRRLPLLHARLLHRDGLSAEARNVLEEELRIRDGAVPAEVPDRASLLVLLGRIEAAEGAFGAALPHLSEAVRLLETTRFPVPADLTDALVALAQAYADAGDPSNALGAFDRAGDVAARELHRGHPLALAAAIGRARSLAATGRASEALPRMRQTVDDVEAQVARVLATASASERAASLTRLADTTDAWAEVAQAAGVDGYEEVLRARARPAWLAVAEQRAFARSTGLARDAHVELRARRRELAALVTTEPGRGWRRVGYAERVGTAAARVDEAFRRVLALDAALPREIAAGAPSLATVRGALGASEVLVEVVRGRASYRAFVVRRGGPARQVVVGSVEAIDAALSAFRDATREAGTTSDAGLRSAGEAARRLAWDPVARHLKGDERVLHVVLDGAYASCPLELLPVGAAGTPLADVVTVVRQPAPAALVPSATPVGAGAVLVGDVDFDVAFVPGRAVTTPDESRRLPSRLPALRRFDRLPASGAEVREVASACVRADARAPVDLLTEDRATEDGLRAAVPGRALVHLATHGFVRTELARAVAPRDDLAAHVRPGFDRFAYVVDPLAASGIVLAGANRRVRGGTDDGILTALEATELDLRAARLVVLSACDTAGGIDVAGAGLAGLVQAFRGAGARAVVASLWPVDDRATAELMGRFYAAWLGSKRSVPEALREACRQLEAARGGPGSVPPRHLAAFVAFGSGR